MISMSGGNISANVDELTLPTNDMTAPRFGTIAANKTEMEEKMEFQLNIQIFTHGESSIRLALKLCHLHVNTIRTMRRPASLTCRARSPVK